MFGERYFATRKRLVRVTDDVRRLAGETGYVLDGFSPDGELVQGLKNPFLFVVSGEVNAGKSTLINGLFGADMCEVNILPQTDRVLWYRHGEEKDVETTPVLVERYRDIDFLRDFNIVDTPGTNSVVKGHQSIAERFLPVADLVLFVFPVSNPWGAATWDFITKFPDEIQGRVVFILQQKDLRSEEELKIIMEHMRELAVQKMGKEPDIFAVSGRAAMEAKKQEPFEQRIWRESGYPALEDFISKVVTESPGRRKLLKDVHDALVVALKASSLRNTGIGLPCQRSSAGLGSKVSIWLGPPYMKRKMTDFARGANCRERALIGFGLSAASSERNASMPKPPPAVCRKCRRFVELILISPSKRTGWS